MVSLRTLAALSLVFLTTLGRSRLEPPCTADSQAVECKAFTKDLALMAEVKPLLLVQKGAATALQEGQAQSRQASPSVLGSSARSISISAGAVTAALVRSPTSAVPQKALPVDHTVIDASAGADAFSGASIAAADNSTTMTSMVLDGPLPGALAAEPAVARNPQQEGRAAEAPHSKRMTRWPDQVVVEKDETTPEPEPKPAGAAGTAKVAAPATYRPNRSHGHGFNLSVHDLRSLSVQAVHSPAKSAGHPVDTGEALLQNNTDGLASASSQPPEGVRELNWKELAMGFGPLLLVAALATAAFRISGTEPVLRSATSKMFKPSAHAALLQEAYDVFEVVSAEKQAEFHEFGGSSKMLFREVRVSRPDGWLFPGKREQHVRDAMQERFFNPQSGIGQTLFAARSSSHREPRQ